MYCSVNSLFYEYLLLCFVNYYRRNTIDPETPYIKFLSKIKFQEESECTVFQEKLTNIFVCSLNGKISALFCN
jgi:uncharacterized membrane protein